MLTFVRTFCHRLSVSSSNWCMFVSHIVPCCTFTLQHLHACVCTLFGREREMQIERERKVYTQWLIHMYMYSYCMSTCVTHLYFLFYMYICVKHCEYMHEHVIYTQWLIAHVHNICMCINENNLCSLLGFLNNLSSHHRRSPTPIMNIGDKWTCSGGTGQYQYNVCVRLLAFISLVSVIFLFLLNLLMMYYV